MSTQNVFRPKQQRSLDTQEKLLSALHHCLQNKFFEHISIKELADQANVSVGTFYRRFKNKESLLPLLYQDFGTDLLQWVDNLEQIQFTSLQDVASIMCQETYLFLYTRKSVFRTLHLNSRLHSEILVSDEIVDRKLVYQRLANIVLRFEEEISVPDKLTAASLVIYTMIGNLLDKVLYADLTPAIACELDAEGLANELPKMFIAYLRT